MRAAVRRWRYRRGPARPLRALHQDVCGIPRGSHHQVPFKRYVGRRGVHSALGVFADMHGEMIAEYQVEDIPAARVLFEALMAARPATNNNSPAGDVLVSGWGASGARSAAHCSSATRRLANDGNDQIASMKPRRQTTQLDPRDLIR